MLRRLMSLFFKSSAKAEEHALKEKITAAVQETERVSEAALSVAVKAELDTIALERVSEATQERLAILDAQRRMRTRNPTVTTATEALKLLQRQ